MATRATRHRYSPGFFALILLLGVGCTDGRKPTAAPLNFDSTIPGPQTSLQAAAEIQFQQQTTEVLSMVVKDGSLYLTGKPFGFSKWAIAQGAENPRLTFASADQSDLFSPMGKWVPDWYASGGLGILGNYAFMSGAFGMSVVSMAETARPREILRFPPLDANSDEVPSDEAYVYKAIVTNPTQPFVYGFREQDFVYTLSASNQVQLVRRNAYSASGTVCCVNSATVFNGNVFVAFQNRLAYYSFGANGELTNPREFRQLQAYNVASTKKYLYVQNEPSYGQGDGNVFPRGIYVFDTAGKNVAFFASSSPINFAVSSDDRHFIANIDNTMVQVFRILWTNQ